MQALELIERRDEDHQAARDIERVLCLFGREETEGTSREGGMQRQERVGQSGESARGAIREIRKVRTAALATALLSRVNHTEGNVHRLERGQLGGVLNQRLQRSPRHVRATNRQVFERDEADVRRGGDKARLEPRFDILESQLRRIDDQRRDRNVRLESLLDDDRIAIRERYGLHTELDRHETSSREGFDEHRLVRDDRDHAGLRAVTGSDNLPRPNTFLHVLDGRFPDQIGLHRRQILPQDRVAHANRRALESLPEDVDHLELNVS